jgi:hypothetical protein
MFPFHSLLHMRKRNGDIAIRACKMIAVDVAACFKLLFALFWKATEKYRYPTEVTTEFRFRLLLKLIMDWSMVPWEGRSCSLPKPCLEIILQALKMNSIYGGVGWGGVGNVYVAQISGRRPASAEVSLYAGVEIPSQVMLDLW